MDNSVRRDTQSPAVMLPRGHENSEHSGTASDPAAAQDLAQLSTAALADRLARYAGEERANVSAFLQHLDEFDRRRGYLDAGHGSLWEYCLRVLHLREGAAGRRIGAMRAARRFPKLVDAIRDGRLCLSTVTLLSAVITDDNFEELVERAAFKTKAEVEHLVASLRPREAPSNGIRRVAGSAAGMVHAIQRHALADARCNASSEPLLRRQDLSSAVDLDRPDAMAVASASKDRATAGDRSSATARAPGAAFTATAAAGATIATDREPAHTASCASGLKDPLVSCGGDDLSEANERHGRSITQQFRDHAVVRCRHNQASQQGQRQHSSRAYGVRLKADVQLE